MRNRNIQFFFVFTIVDCFYKFFISLIQLFTMFDISVDQYFYPSKNTESSCRKRINAMLNSLDEKDLQVVEATIQALKNARETEVK